MIVKCRDNSYKKSISQGTEYFVFEQQNGGYYKVINDLGIKEDYEKERFTTVIQNEKEVNMIEAINMPVGTEFIVKFKDGRIETEHIKIITNENGTKLFLWCDNEEVKTYNALLNSKFIPLERPVSFMEVVNSEKDCRVEHPLLDIVVPTEEDNSYYYEFNNKGYLPLNCLLHILGGHLGVREVKKVINEGKWYIEED